MAPSREHGKGKPGKSARATSAFVTEGAAKVRIPPGVFYNPEMKFCRDISVLAATAAMQGKKAKTVDATAGSGIRAVRYAMECSHAVGDVFLVDISPTAARTAKANARRNGIAATAVGTSFSRFANSAHAKGGFQFIELDPFGSPVPFLYDAMRLARGGTLLSVTATDTAVLCGAHSNACIKNYQSKPLNPFCCHEVGARILLGKIARVAAEFDFGITPVFTLSHRHYFKAFLFLNKGAQPAVNAMKSLGFAAHCNKCLHREFACGVAPAVASKCPECGTRMEFAGPLWLGSLHDSPTIERMLVCAGEDSKAGRMLSLMRDENSLPPLYFELPRMTERCAIGALKRDDFIARVRAAGYSCTRTHFNPDALKTNASARALFSIMGQAKAI